MVYQSRSQPVDRRSIDGREMSGDNLQPINVDEKVSFAAAALQLLGPNMVCQAKMDLPFKGLHRTKQWAAKRTLETPW